MTTINQYSYHMLWVFISTVAHIIQHSYIYLNNIITVIIRAIFITAVIHFHPHYSVYPFFFLYLLIMEAWQCPFLFFFIFSMKKELFCFVKCHFEMARRSLCISSCVPCKIHVCILARVLCMIIRSIEEKK